MRQWLINVDHRSKFGIFIVVAQCMGLALYNLLNVNWTRCFPIAKSKVRDTKANTLHKHNYGYIKISLLGIYKPFIYLLVHNMSCTSHQCFCLAVGIPRSPHL